GRYGLRSAGSGRRSQDPASETKGLATLDRAGEKGYVERIGSEEESAMEVTRGFGVFVASGALALACAATSEAKCGGMTGFMNIGTAEQNPFEAELKVTHPDSETAFTRHLALPAEKIARDSLGRVRIERVAGKYKMDNGPEAGMEVEQHLVLICDPTKQTLTQVDSVHKTATILRRLEVVGRPKASNLQAISFCSGVKRVLQGISSEI